MAYCSEQYCGPVCLENINDERNTPHSKLLHLCETYSGRTLAGDIKRFIGSLKMTNVAINDQWQNALHVTCANYSRGRDLFEAVKVLLDAGIPVNNVDRAMRTALHHLMLRDNLQQVNETVKLLIERKIDIQCRDIDWGRSALHLLCSRPRNDTPIQLVRTLLNNGLDVKLLDYELRTALHVLCQNTQMCNRTDIAEAMIACGFDLVNAETVRGNNALHCLFITGNYSAKRMALFLMEHGINVNSPNEDGMYPLHVLCQNYKGDDLLEIITSLAEHQAYMNCKTKENRNALHLVLQYYTNKNKLIDVVDYLIALRVDVNDQDCFGETPFHSYFYKRADEAALNLSIKRELLERMAKHGVSLFDACSAIEGQDASGQTAEQHFACIKTSDELWYSVASDAADKLLDLCQTSHAGSTLAESLKKFAEELVDLYRTCHHDADSPLAKSLIELTAINKKSTLATNQKGQNALHVTCANYQGQDLLKVVRFLIVDVGIAVNSVDLTNRNALHLLMQRDNVQQLNQVVDLLIEKGIDIHRTDITGNSALHLLCSRHDDDTPIDLVLLLLENKLDVHLLDCKCETALHALCRNSYMCHRVDIAEAMIACCETDLLLLNAESIFGNNALHCLFEQTGSRMNNIMEMALFLIKNKGINLNKPNTFGMYPLHLLCQNYKGDDLLDIVAIFAEHQADINCKTKKGKNVLHLVFQHYTNNGQLKNAIDDLIAWGVDVTAKDDFGILPIAYLYARDPKCMPDDATTTEELLKQMNQYGISFSDILRCHKLIFKWTI